MDPIRARVSQMSRRKTTGEGIPDIGSIFKGTVVSIQTFGAFIQIEDGTKYRDGLLHISGISSKRINKVEDCLDYGEEVYVKVSQVKELDGKYSLDMRYVNQETGKDLDPENEQGPVPENGGKMPAPEKNKGAAPGKDAKEDAKESSDSDSSSEDEKTAKTKKEKKKEKKAEKKDKVKQMALKKLKKQAKKLKKLQKKAAKKEKKKAKGEEDSSSDSDSSSGDLEARMLKAQKVVEKLGKIAGIEVPAAQQPQGDVKLQEANNDGHQRGGKGRADSRGRGEQWRDDRRDDRGDQRRDDRADYRRDDRGDYRRDGKGDDRGEQWRDGDRQRADSRAGKGKRRGRDNNWRGDSQEPAARRQRVDYESHRDADSRGAWNGNDRPRDDWEGKARGKNKGESRDRQGRPAGSRDGGAAGHRVDSRDQGGPTGPWLKNSGGRNRDPDPGRNGGGRQRRNSRIPERGEVIKRPYNNDQRDGPYKERSERPYNNDRGDRSYNDRGRY